MNKQPYKQGKKIESEFADALLAHSADISFLRDSEEREDIEEHFDKVFINNKTQKIFSVDSKSPSKYGDNYFWVEDMAVFAPNQLGATRLGSVHGKADWMAWKMSDHFLMVRRSYLLLLMKTKVDKSNPILEFSASADPKKYLYKYRGRVDYNTKEERGDRVSLFCVKDLNDKHYRKIPIQKTETFINQLF
mgnify:CR=1 FL=1|jgi:hypothetical protein